MRITRRSQSTTREEVERRQVPLYQQGGTREEVGPIAPLERRNHEVVKN